MMADGEFKTLVKVLWMCQVIDWVYTGMGLYQGWGYEANPLYMWINQANFHWALMLQGVFLMWMTWALWRWRGKPFVQRLVLMLAGARVGTLWAMMLGLLGG